MEPIKNKKTLNLGDVTSWFALCLERSHKTLMNVLHKPSPLVKLSLPASNTPQTLSNPATIPPTPKFSKESTISTGSTSSAASNEGHFVGAFIETAFQSIRKYLGGIP